jgi:hypothetical protein
MAAAEIVKACMSGNVNTLLAVHPQQSLEREMKIPDGYKKERQMRSELKEDMTSLDLLFEAASIIDWTLNNLDLSKHVSTIRIPKFLEKFEDWK